MNLFKNWDPFAATKIDGVTVILGGKTTSISQIYFTDNLPPLQFSKIEKLYWQNDIDGVNNLIEQLLNATDVKRLCIHFSKRTWKLRDIGITAFGKPSEVIDVCNIRPYDVFFAIDSDGDLVRAEVGE